MINMPCPQTIASFAVGHFGFVLLIYLLERGRISNTYCTHMII